MRSLLRIGLLVLAACLLTACTKIPEDDELQLEEHQPDQHFHRARITLFNGDLPRARLDALHMQQFDNERMILCFDSVEAVSWDSLGQVESLMTCDTVYFHRDHHNIKARWNVEIYSPYADPETGEYTGGAPHSVAELLAAPYQFLATDWLDWNDRVGRLRTDAPVYFESPTDTVWGVGFTSNRDLSNWEIYQVEGVSHRPLDRPKRERRRAEP